MTSKENATVSVTQKNDDGKWYYVIVVGGEPGSRTGPYETEDEAMAAGEAELENQTG